MSSIRSGARISCVAIIGAVIAGCGGGQNMAALVPAVAFLSPSQAQTIALGQAVHLQWATDNVTSCVASTATAGAGDFTGAQPAAGSAVIAPTAVGTFSYALSCTGPHGSAVGKSMAVTVNPSILSTLSVTKIATIGSTIDPIEHGGNPYGLAIASATAGLVMAGDLIVCNFNDGATNTQGLGTTVIGLHPAAGSTPYRIAQSASLQGCNAVTALADGSIAAAAWTANANPLIASSGAVSDPFSVGVGGFDRPWGEVYVPATAQNGPAIYFSNFAGSIHRISLDNDVQTTSTEIVKGFCTSGAPGAIFAPSGLTYDALVDTLYVVDTSSNSVVAIADVSSIGADGIVVNGQCASVGSPPTPAPTFAGPSAASARVIAHGGGFIAPISAALLSNGDLVVGNGDINISTGQMANLLFEISPVLSGGFVGEPVQLDTSGTPGALFGIATAVDGSGNQLIYFNDDNTNTVMLLTK